MSAVPPRHLAPRRRRHRLLILTAGGAAVALAGVVTVMVAAGGPADRGTPVVVPPPGAAPGLRAPASTAPPTTARPGRSATTSEPARPLRPVPGNLLANGDFEPGLGGWGALGGARVERVATAHSGSWAARISPGGSGAAGRPGIAIPLAVQARQGRTYQGSVWVRASRPGIEATLALREYGAGRQSSADVTGVNLPDAQWHEVAVVHQIHLAGAQLALEVAGGNLGAGDLILVDEVGVTVP